MCQIVVRYAARAGEARQLEGHPYGSGRRLDDDVALLLLEATSPPAWPGQDAPAVMAPGQHAVPGRRPLAGAYRRDRRRSPAVRAGQPAA